MRDFLNLHAHYKVSNVTGSGLKDVPAFPKRQSLPYFTQQYLGGGSMSNKSGGDKDDGKPDSKAKRAEFARGQRAALETYLLKLIRACMFRPEANRLCKFLEISALSIELCGRGGSQGKQGYLRVLSSGISRKKSPGIHPFQFKQRHEPKWFVVRESYITAVDEPDQNQIWDVILVDSEFKLERPRRLYRQTLNAVKAPFQHGDDDDEDQGELDGAPSDERKPGGKNGAGDPNDPSTTDAAKNDPDALKDASGHTFYVSTAERRVKLVAKNVRQMDQFVASIERMVAKTVWAGKNRFESFAPIRRNVAAQWLVDGRDYFYALSRAVLLAKEKIYVRARCRWRS